MYISRLVIRNFRNFELMDVPVPPGAICLIGENNVGKSNLLHALRLAVDSNLSSSYRVLSEQDIHSGITISKANQVIVSVEFSDYYDKTNETALVGCWEVDDQKHIARIIYRFRPKRDVREALDNKEIKDGELTIDHYHWELTGGGEADPAKVKWSEDLGGSVRFSDLQNFQVVFLHALRDVNQDLRQSRQSPLAKLIDSSEIPDDEKNDLVSILEEANEAISKKKTIHETGTAIENAFQKTAGEAFEMSIKLGMADPSFTSLSRSLTLLLSNTAVQDFETYRNGLGLNNILYTSMLIESFERRVKNKKSAGQILLIEEPEAHLHPQLQRVLYEVLKNKPFQTIVSSHSTHITSSSKLSSVVLLTNDAGIKTVGTTPAHNGLLKPHEIADLERYLDATRSTLLYARKVILVEGPAELFILPPLIKKVLGIDLERFGVAVIPIFGTHFDVYAKLFNELAMPKKCAIITDGDLQPSDGEDSDEEPPASSDLKSLENEYVGVFQNSTTFERELVIPGLLPCLQAAAKECGAKKLEKALKDAHENGISPQAKKIELQDKILAAAKRIGKARFAQIVSKHINLAQAVPPYIEKAIKWLELHAIN